jgi:hypothetical protein
MTVNEAIEALTRARDEVGGDAPLLMADGLHVVDFPLVGDGCVYVCDVPQPEDDEEARDAAIDAWVEQFRVESGIVGKPTWDDMKAWFQWSEQQAAREPEEAAGT